MKGSQPGLQEEITTAFNEPVFPINEWQAPPEADHGRIEQRQIVILPAEALSEYIRERWLQNPGHLSKESYALEQKSWNT